MPFIQNGRSRKNNSHITDYSSVVQESVIRVFHRKDPE
jgi:hypothetical protein